MTIAGIIPCETKKKPWTPPVMRVVLDTDMQLWAENFVGRPLTVKNYGKERFRAEFVNNPEFGLCVNIFRVYEE